MLKLYQQLLHQRAALRFGNAWQLFEIGHGRIWTVDDGDIWKVTLTHHHSSLIYPPRLIEKLQLSPELSGSDAGYRGANFDLTTGVTHDPTRVATRRLDVPD
ncbi:MAG: hypothetical protein WAM94_11635, partial [Chromatiaceae bacterium]